ncbi:MAG: PEP-CTERM sorting domain-containing protein [Sandarakinorhabdus sp.]|nr:PEP-CTERM sorting domain-containing protein [Sandarakinorhabdus sp.]
MNKAIILGAVAAAVGMSAAPAAALIVPFATYASVSNSFKFTNSDVFSNTIAPGTGTSFAGTSLVQNGNFSVSHPASSSAVVTNFAAGSIVTNPNGTTQNLSYQRITTPAYTYTYNATFTKRTRVSAPYTRLFVAPVQTVALQSNGGSVANIPTLGNLEGYSAYTKVSFSFINNSLAPYVSNVPAYLILSATSVAKANTAFGLIGQDVLNGSFQIVLAHNLSIKNHPFVIGDKLLDGTFSSAVISGSLGSTSGGLSSSTLSGATLTFNDSQFLTFGNTVNRDFQIGVNSVTTSSNPMLNTGLSKLYQNSSLKSFTSSSQGTFSSDPAPVVVAVPEPEIWGLMVVGFGLVGVQVRRRARQSAVAA